MKIFSLIKKQAHLSRRFLICKKLCLLSPTAVFLLVMSQFGFSPFLMADSSSKNSNMQEPSDANSEKNQTRIKMIKDTVGLKEGEYRLVKGKTNQCGDGEFYWSQSETDLTLVGQHKIAMTYFLTSPHREKDLNQDQCEQVHDTKFSQKKVTYTQRLECKDGRSEFLRKEELTIEGDKISFYVEGNDASKKYFYVCEFQSKLK